MKNRLTLILVAVSLLLASCSETEKAYSSLADLNGHDVGVLVGGYQDLMLSTSEPDIKFHQYTSNALLLQALITSNVDAILVDKSVVQNLNADGCSLETEFGGITPSDISFAFSSSRTRELQKFNVFLEEIKKTGIYDEILDRWTSGPAEDLRVPEIEMQEGGEVLNVGLLGADIPFAFTTGDGFAGLEPELLERFAALYGYRIKYHEYELSTLITAIQNGKVDIASALLLPTEERISNALFSDPYYSAESVCVTLSDVSRKEGNIFSRMGTKFRNNLVSERRFSLILEGLWVTFIISLFSIVIGTAAGFFLCSMLYSRRRHFWEKLVKVFGSIMRGIPLLIFLMFMYYVVFAGSGIPAVVVSIVTFAIYFTYVSCEVLHSGVESVGKGQMESAKCLGFNRKQIYKYILLPQAIKHVVPFYEEEAVNMIKETSLVGFIAVVDLTKASELIQSRTFDAFFPILVASLIYYLIAWLFGKALEKVNVKLSHRK